MTDAELLDALADALRETIQADDTDCALTAEEGLAHAARIARAALAEYAEHREKAAPGGWLEQNLRDPEFRAEYERQQADVCSHGVNTAAVCNQCDAKAAPEPARMFPIQDGPPVPWAMVAPHEKQMLRNHGNQTFEQMARRGGLSVIEIVAVLEDRKFPFEECSGDRVKQEAMRQRYLDRLAAIVRAGCPTCGMHRAAPPEPAPPADPRKHCRALAERWRSVSSYRQYGDALVGAISADEADDSAPRFPIPWTED